MNIKNWAVGLTFVLGLVACGSDDEKEKASGSAAHICTEQIACGYQLADQASCVELFEAFFEPAQIADCDACVSAEACETEQATCMSVCSL